ncbi:hypothetical protein DERF_005547, partial [Dermatophagoides farinae]
MMTIRKQKENYYHSENGDDDSESGKNILDAICHVYVCSIQSLCTNLISRNQTEKKPMNKRCITENNQ